MFFKYNLLLSQENFNDLIHALKFNQTILDERTRKDSIKLIDCFFNKSKITKQNDIEMITICLTELQLQDLLLQLTSTTGYFLGNGKEN